MELRLCRCSNICILLMISVQIIFGVIVLLHCSSYVDTSNKVEDNFYLHYQEATDSKLFRSNTAVVHEIDMINAYEPYLDFKLVYPDVQPKTTRTQNLFLVVLVNSASSGEVNRNRRSKIRETWASKSLCEASNNELKWIVVFVLGLAGNLEDKQNIDEANTYNDVIIGNISDNYFNNILKFYMGQMWASLNGAKYTLKTDDDVYIRIPKVIEYIISEGYPSKFYGGVTYHGSVVARWPGGKWSISKKYFPEDKFPPFNAGAFILCSTDLIGHLINYVYIRKPFHTDDAYIGVAMRDLNVKIVNILSFAIDNNMAALIHTKGDCYMLKIIAYGHGVGFGAMDHIHNRLESLCKANFTINSMKCTK